MKLRLLKADLYLRDLEHRQQTLTGFTRFLSEREAAFS
jgi:hypothetical protein